MYKKKSLIYFSILFLILFSSIIGFSSFVLNVSNKTENDITHKDDTTSFHNINVHYETIAEGLETKTEYFIPDSYSISHSITDVNESGQNYGTEKMAAPSGGTLTNEDPIQIYYDVYNGKRTKIQRRSNGDGPEQIKSFSCDIKSWTQVSDDTSYAVVWKTNVTKTDGTVDYLRFQCDSGNQVTHGQKWSIGDIYISDQIISQNTEIIDGSTVTTTIYQRITIYDVDEIVYGSVKQSCTNINYCTWVYYPQYEIRMTKITTKGHEPVYYDNVNTIKVKDNSIITPFDLEISNYLNYGYYSSINFNEYFDFSCPITDDKDIYLRYIESSDYLASRINNLESGTLNLYDQYRGGSGEGINVGNDMTYHIYTNSVFIDSSTIKKDAIVNLTYGAEEIYISPNVGSLSDNLGSHRTTNDDAIAPDYTGTANSLTYCGNDQASIYIILNGDLIINGTLNIGGEIGGKSASSYYSYIIGRYAYVDLHGHNIIINSGGILNNYGLIKDTVGGGEIIINDGGKITSTVTIADARGRDQAAVGLSKRQSLFTEYNISYLQVPCKFYKGSSFIGYCKIDFQELGIVNSYITFIGNTFNNSMFNFRDNSSSTDYVLYEPYKISSLSTPNSNVIYTRMYNHRSRFIFNANIQEAGSYIIKATLSNSTNGDINADFDFARIDFPISPMFDFVVNRGYSLDVYSKMTFYPGSSLYAIKGSTINFKSSGYKTYNKISATGDTLAISGESRYIAGGLMSYTSNIKDLASYNYADNRFGIGLYNQSSYWTYVKPSNMVIDGNITFDSSIDTNYSDGRYFISGKFSLGDEAIASIQENRNYVQTCDVKAELNGGFFYSKDSQNLKGQYEKATSFNLNPLILNNEAYILDKDHNMKGTYDVDTGILTVDNSMYYLQMDNDLYTDGSGSANQSSTIDRTIIVKQVASANVDYKIIKDIDDKLYVYYCGIYVPIIDPRYSYGTSITNGYNLSVNLRKFHSNRDNSTYIGSVTRYSYDSANETYVIQSAESNVVKSPLYDNCLIYYSTSSRKWTFRGFIK